MRSLVGMCGMMFCVWSVTALATDVINQDKREYKIKVQGEGKLSISHFTVRAGGSQYGMCNYSFCTFEIPGSKIAAGRNAKLFIRNGKFTK